MKETYSVKTLIAFQKELHNYLKEDIKKKGGCASVTHN